MDDVEAWRAWIETQGVPMLEEVPPLEEGRALMFEGPDRLAIEFVETGWK